MPLNLASLAANHADLTVDFGGGATLDISYLPAKITSQMLLDVTAMQQQAQANTTPEQVQAAIETPARLLLSLLASWELVETDAEGVDQLVPLTMERLLGLGLSTVWTILNTIITAQADTSGKSSASAANG